MKYRPGRIFIIFFNTIGSQQHVVTWDNESMTDAQDHAQALIEKGEHASYAILRVIDNSAATWDKWRYKEQSQC